MKIEEPEFFHPITVTLETKEEFDEILRVSRLPIHSPGGVFSTFAEEYRGEKHEPNAPPFRHPMMEYEFSKALHPSF